MGTEWGVCAILPDWHSATFRGHEKERIKALLTKNYCKGGSEYSEIFDFQVDISEKYKMTAILSQKVTKNRTTTNIVKNSRTRDGKYEAFYRGNNAR